MPIRNTKTPDAYKAEFNNCVRGATALMERAAQVRKNLAATGKRGNRFATGPVASATNSLVTSLKGLATFKGDGERNPRPASSARR